MKSVLEDDPQVTGMGASSAENGSVTLGTVTSPPTRISIWGALGVNYSATCAALVVYPDTEPQQWHIYLIMTGINISTWIWNIPLFTALERVNRISVILINVGSLFIFATLLAKASPKRDTASVWVDIVNDNGWSTGVNMLMAFLPGLNCVSGFVMLLVAAYCTTNPDNLLAPIGGQPGIQMMIDTFGSLPLVVIGSLVLVLVLNNASTSLMTVNSRMLWAFARQEGLPLSKFLGRLGWRELPHNAVIAGVILAVAIGAIQLGSTIVVNAILGSAIICCNISYSIPIGLLLLSPRREEMLGPRWFTLGKFGRVINLIALLWIVLASVALSFPVYLPIEVANMNFASIAVAAVALIPVVTWFTMAKRHYFTPGAVAEYQ